MQYRPLGRTGVQVSPLCLGAMMFGPWGSEDEADSIRIIHRALDAGINSRRHRRRVLRRCLGGDRRQALKDRREDVFLATKFFMPTNADDPQPAWRLPSLDHP